MVTPYMLDEHGCQIFYVNRVPAWNKVPEFRKSVDNHPDSVFPIRFRKSCNEVHCNVFPRFSRNRERSENSVWSMPSGFCSSTHVAVLNEFLDILPHA